MPAVAAWAASKLAAALIAVGVKTAAAKTAAVIAVKLATTTALAVGAQVLMAPDVNRGGQPGEWRSDPNGPIPFALGGPQRLTGFNVHRDEYGPENMYETWVMVLSGAGPIQGISKFFADDVEVAFDGSEEAIGHFADKMWLSWRLGGAADTALASPPGLRGGATLPDWTPDHRLPGKTCAMWTLGHDSKGKVYRGEPKPSFQILGGVPGWDPREDDAWGGAGDQVLADPATYGPMTNAIIGGLNWALGLRENGKVTGGMGLSVGAVDVDSFIACANLAEGLAWTYAARPTTDDDKWEVLKGLLEAGGAAPVTVGGRLRCVHRATPKVSVVTITAADLAGEPEIELSNTYLGRVNTLIPVYREANNRWDLTPGDPVSVPAFVEEDQGERPRERPYPYVDDKDQAAQAATLDLYDSREPVSGVLPCKPYLRGLKPGDCFTLDAPELGLSGLKCIVRRRPDFDLAQAVARVAFRSETDAKYTAMAAAAGGTPPAPYTPPDTDLSPPDTDDWTATPGTGETPSVVLTGEVTNPLAGGVQFEVRLDGETDWRGAATFQDASVETVQVPLPGGGDWEVAVRYRSDLTGQWSDRTVLDPVSVPGLPEVDVILPPRVNLGATGDIVFTPNQTGSGASSQGEIRIQGTRLYVPGRGQVSNSQTQMLTNYEGSGAGSTGRAYILLSSTALATRFSGWEGQAGYIFPAAYDPDTGVWTAKGGNTDFAMTLASDDVLLGYFERDSQTGGIHRLISLIAAGHGALAGKTTVDTPDIEPEAVTERASAFTSGTINLGGTTHTTIQELVVEATGETLDFLLNYYLVAENSSSFTVFLNIDREPYPYLGSGRTTIYTQQIYSPIAGADFVGPYPFFFDDTPLAGDYTYRATIAFSRNDMSTETAESRFLRVLNAKR